MLSRSPPYLLVTFPRNWWIRRCRDHWRTCRLRSRVERDPFHSASKMMSGIA